MHHEWVLDVLTDLATFARENRLPALAEHLDDARQTAVEEIVRASDPSAASALAVAADAGCIRERV